MFENDLVRFGIDPDTGRGACEIAEASLFSRGNARRGVGGGRERTNPCHVEAYYNPPHVS